MNSQLLRRQLAKKKGINQSGGFAPPGSAPPRAGKKLEPIRIHTEIQKAVERAERKAEKQAHKKIQEQAPRQAPPRLIPLQRVQSPIIQTGNHENHAKRIDKISQSNQEQILVSPSRSKRFDRISVAGGGVAARPDASFFAQKRALKQKRIAFQHSGINPIQWEAKGNEKWEPKSISPPIDYAACARSLHQERFKNKELAKLHCKGTFSFQQAHHDQDAYWTSGQDLFAGRLDASELRNQYLHNANTRNQLTKTTFELGFDKEYS